MKYIGQTGWSLLTRYREHFRDYKYGNEKKLAHSFIIKYTLDVVLDGCIIYGLLLVLAELDVLYQKKLKYMICTTFFVYFQYYEKII